MSGAYNPLTGTGSDSRWGERFVPMSDAWDKSMRECMRGVADKLGMGAHVNEVSA